MNRNKILSLMVSAVMCCTMICFPEQYVVKAQEKQKSKIYTQVIEQQKLQESKENENLSDDNLKISLDDFLKAKENIKSRANQFFILPNGQDDVDSLWNGLKVHNTNFNWNGDLNLINKPDTIYLHHIEASRRGQTIPVTDIHQWHLANGWAGIGYHFYIAKDGSIYRGRPENAIGAHTLGHNVNSLGIAVEGKYDTEHMPEVQKQAVIKLGEYLREKYNISHVYGHGEKVSTDCPGRNYPLNEIRNAILQYKTNQDKEKNILEVQYQTNVQNSGWQEWKENGQLSGTTGQSKRVEGVKIKLNNAPQGLHIKYKLHIEDYGWMNWNEDGNIGGVIGQGKRIEAMQIKLEGNQAENYTVQYRTHVQDIGWQDWRENGQLSGTTGQSKRIEAVEIKIIKKKGEIKENIEPKNIEYQIHGQDYGWQNWVENGQLAGTTGLGKRVEAIRVKLKDKPSDVKVRYRAYVQETGWQDWKEEGQLAGTTGKGKRIEAIQIKLNGENSFKYHVEYRTHVEDIGWTPWVKDGKISGTVGQEKRIEAIEMRIVK